MAAKIGQILSARTDIFSGELIQSLSKLRSHYQIDSFVPSQVDVDQLPPGVTHINYQVLKAGTICVVFKCRYKKKPAVIKIVKMGVAQQLSRVFSVMLWFLWLISYFDPCFLYQRISEIKKTFLKQTDLNQEAKNQMYWYRHYNSKRLGIPKVYAYNKYAILMERIPDKKSEIVNLSKEQQQKHALALYMSVYDSLYLRGKVHADLHPGNIIFNGKKFYLIDFGWCVQLDEYQKKHNVLLGLAFRNKDYHQLAQRVSALYFPGKTIQDELEKELKEVKLFQQQHTVTGLSRVISTICMKYRLKLSAAGSATESAMVNIDGMLPYLFKDVNTQDIRAKSFTCLQSQLCKYFE